MERSRFDSPYTRRDRHSGADTREDSKTVDLFMKFRQFRPYLKCRLTKIHADNREREFREEVDDIKYFLSVMSDMLADENHGAAALQGFIDRIHEMVRKNPLSEGSYQNETDPEDDDEPDTAPRSPSPTEAPYDSYSGPTTTTARTIPLERNAPDFTYFDTIEASIERGIHDRKKPAPAPRNPWDPFNQRGPSQDVDMRNAPIFKPMINTTPLGQGAPRPPSQYQENNNINNNGNYRSTSFGRGISRDPPPRDENFYDWDNQRRENKNYAPSNNSSSSSQGYRREGNSFSDKNNDDIDDPWRGDGFDSFGRGGRSSDYNRAPSSFSREQQRGGGDYSSSSSFSHGSERDRQDYSRDFSRRDHNLQRGSSFSKEAGYGREPQQQRTREEDAMFERRSQPQFERRRRPSNTTSSYDQDGSSVHDYNHGEEDQGWNNNNSSNNNSGNVGSSTSGIDRDMRYPPSSTSTNPGVYPPQNSYDLNQQQHQMYLNSQQQHNMNFGVNNANNFMQNPSSSLLGVNPMMAAMQLQSGLLSGFSPNVPPPPRVQPGFVTPAASSSSVPSSSSLSYNFPEGGGVSSQKSNPPPPTTTKPPVVDPTDPEERLKELFKQKAQQAFGRNKPPHRKESVHHNINNIVPPTPSHHQKVVAPQKSPQGGLLASNQMLSDRDPRLNRPQNKRHPSSQGFSTSQNESHAAAERRVELDPRLARREQQRPDSDNNNKYRQSDHHHHHNRPDKNRPIDKHGRDDAGSTENRDRVVRVNLDEPEASYSNSRRLDETRNRVKARLPTPSSDQNKSGSKLQEIRKQVENERVFHALGRPTSKKPSSFDEAIVVPVEIPTRPHPKEATSSSSSKSNQKNKEISKETDNTTTTSSGSQNKEALSKGDKEKVAQKDKSQTTSPATGKSGRQQRGGRQRNASSGNDSDNASGARKSGQKRNEKSNSRANQRLKKSNKNTSQSRSDAESLKKTPSFRIPKIKKPDPPPPPPSPPRSPSPEPPSQEVDMSSNNPSNSRTDTTNISSEEERLRQVTDDIIRKFVMTEMDKTQASSILDNPEVMELIKDRLKIQVLELFARTKSSTLQEQQSSTETLQEPEALPEAESADVTETTEPGGHRSRSVTRKRNSKRRSSLEKLHDALKEMRFDAMLPLGPRRCTLGQVEETQHESGSSSTTTNTELSSKDAPSTSAASTKKSSSKMTDVSKSANNNNKPSTSATAGGGDTSTTTTTKLGATGKKGTKRKRKASKVKPNKKKKGPVTRAQAAVKTAIKIQHKPGQKKKKGKNVASPDESRITRSMRSGGGIKIKLEPVEIKEEPEDPSYGDTVGGSEMEYLTENQPPPEPQQPVLLDDFDMSSKDNETTNTNNNSLLPAVSMDLPSFNQDQEDFMFINDEMSIDIKDEPGSEPEEMQIDIDEPDIITDIKIEMVDYNADLTDFLPDIPTMENDNDNCLDENAVYTPALAPEATANNNNSAMNKILDQIDQIENGQLVTFLEPHNSDLGDSLVKKECFDVVDSMLDEIVEQQYIIMEQQAGNITAAAAATEESSVVDVEGHTAADYSSSDNESEEPNDFFQIQSDNDDDAEFSKADDNNKQQQEQVNSTPPIIVSQTEQVLTTFEETQKDPTPNNNNSDDNNINIDLNLVKTEVFEEDNQNHNLVISSCSSISIKQEVEGIEQAGIEENGERDDQFPDLLYNSSEREELQQQMEVDEGTPLGSKVEFKSRMKQTTKSDVVEESDIDAKSTFLPNCDPSTSDPEAEAGRLTNLRGRDLYKCPNAQCDFQAANTTLFKDHVPGCLFTTDSKSFGCPHCDKRVKAVINLLEHLKTHGQQKQMCSLCTYKTWATSELTRHMKSFHKVYNHKAEKLEATEPDDDPALVIYPKDVASRISTAQELKDSYACYADRLVFSPYDTDKVPNRQIFQTLAFCASCSYSSKVRINFLRHLQTHIAAVDNPDVLIPISDPVNPVPCLERKELFFDKMTNWAGSSHENKQGNANSDSSGLPQFVSEQFRYVCNVKGCEQITVDEYMLRTHIKTLHSDVEFYNCPHCDKHEVTRNDKRNTVSVEKLGAHLKMHGRKLYRCAYCDVIHTQVVQMEKHLPEKHPERKPIHYLIRNLDSEGNAANRRNSNDDNITSDTWRCTLCASKQLFSTYREVKSHCTLTHKIGSQFVCFECKFKSDDDVLMSNHVMECGSGKILIMWYRSEFNAKPEAIIYGPLWKRSASSVKHIRGIFLEDVKEKTSRADKQDGPRQSLFSSSEKIASPAIVGKTNRRPYKPPQNNSGGAKQSSSQDAKLFTCPKCNLFKTKSATNMRVHLYNEMGYQRYRCTKCNIKFVTESSLKGHMIGDHGASLDENCFELLPVDSEIENYVNTFFSSEEEKSVEKSSPLAPSSSSADSTDAGDKQPTFTCKHCSQECQSAHNLKTHVLAKHIASDRYACGHCKTTFWNQALVRNHHTRGHRDLPYSIEENFSLDLNPEFWSKEYGLPNVPTRRGLKRSLDGDAISEPTPTTSDENNSLSSRIPDLEMTDDDGLLFDFATCDIDPALIDDVRLALSSNGTTDDVLLQQLFEDTTNTASSSAAANRAQNQNSFAYKCFHCGENSLSVRGARSHWEKVHSLRPEERCNYYEYKAFNQNSELPPCIQLICSFCDFTTSCLSLIHDHHDAVHAGNPFRMKRKLRVGFMVFECGVCFHECCTADQILDHISNTHPSIQDPSYLTTDLREKMEQNPNVFMGKLVEDTVRYACDDPICSFDFETRAESVNHMVSDHGIMSRKSNIKYNRHIINQRIRVPIDEETIEPSKIGFQKIGYQCPQCDFQAEDRQKLVTEHLGEHVHTYICPTCNKSFRSYVDTKFHIRLQHADPKGTPLINREMVKGREILENAIVQVKMPGRKPSTSSIILI